MNKRKLKKIIITLLILLIILCAVLIMIVFSKENRATRNVKKVNNLKETYSDYIMPLNRLELMDKYKGKLSSETIYTLLYQFANKIVPQLRNSNIEDVERYFKKNEEYIYIITGITEKDEFKQLVNKINNLPNELTCSKLEIKEGSAQKIKGGVEAVLTIYYNDNIELDVDITVQNKEDDSRTSIIFK